MQSAQTGRIFCGSPFKAQNMSSNAYYLENGLQMAKSQAIAAYACGIEPDVNMNPVLLKPTNLAGSEVILNGEPVGILKNFEYNELKKDCRKVFYTHITI